MALLAAAVGSCFVPAATGQLVVGPQAAPGPASRASSLAAYRLKLAEDPTDAQARSAVGDLLKTERQFAVQLAGALVLARADLQLGDLPQARAQFARVETLLDAPLADPATSRQGRLRIVYEYLRGDLLDEGLRVLAEVVEADGTAAGGGARLDPSVIQREAAATAALEAAVAGLLNRRLLQLSAAARYRKLHDWVLGKSPAGGEDRAARDEPPGGEPPDTPAAVPVLRTFSARCSAETPPPVFARALGERPRGDAFPVARVAGFSGLFSAAWELVAAARQQGRLAELTTELETLARQLPERPAAPAPAPAAPAAPAPAPDGVEPALGDPATRADGDRVVAAAAQTRRSVEFLLALTRLAAGKLAEGQAEAVGTFLPPLPENTRTFLFVDQTGIPRQQLAVRDDRGVLRPAPLTELSREAVRAQVLVAATAEVPGNAPVGERLLEALGKYETTVVSPHELRRLNDYLRSGKLPATEREYPGHGLRHWSASRVPHLLESATGVGEAAWIALDNHLFSDGAASRSLLTFRYPLAGDFRWVAEAQIAGFGSGQSPGSGLLAFGGAELGAAWGGVQVNEPLFSPQFLRKNCPLLRTDAEPQFYHLELAHSPAAAKLKINRHAAHQFTPADAFPWFSLATHRGQPLAFRNVRLEGTPEIPREVRLSSDAQLRGWTARRYGRTQPGYPAAVPEAPRTAIGSLVRSFLGRGEARPQWDWEWEAEEIRGRRADVAVDDSSESTLTCLRPLHAGEQVAYEFFYRPDELVVHPAIGRVALVLDPGGVRLHWLTDGLYEWTGLDSANQVSDLLSRRGPRKLPLKVDAWNRVHLAITPQVVQLTLNDELVYEHKRHPLPPATFSFYYDQVRHAARVRNVVLRGDWPAEVPVELWEGTPRQPETVRRLAALADERAFAAQALQVYRQARQLSLEERYRYLSAWVLPSAAHPLRLAGAFTPTHPPAGFEDGHPEDARRLQAAREAGRTRVEVGGNLVSPAIELVHAAQQLGRLADVRRAVEQYPPENDLQRRSQLTMQMLLAIAQDEPAAAVEHLSNLFPLVVFDARPQGTFAEVRRQTHQRWPDLIAVSAALRHPALREMAENMAQHLYVQQVRTWSWHSGDAWDQHAMSLMGVARHLNQSQAPLERFHTPPNLKHWHAVPDYQARTRGAGAPRVHWEATGGEVHKYSTHLRDALYFNRPLRGNFQVDYDIPVFNWRETQVTTGGVWANLRYNLNSVRHGTIRSAGQVAIDPPFIRPKNTMHMRVVMQDGIRTTYCNGRFLHQTQLPADYDPWLSIKSRQDNAGGVFNLQITGKPEVPREIDLLPEGIVGWRSYYDYHPMDSTSQGGWMLSDGEFAGAKLSDTLGHDESLVHYHRPMLEDGEISYEFYYAPGEVEVHPAIDRVAFLLEPEGVSEHLLTDGPYETLGRDPAHRARFPERQLGGKLPLRENAWNQMRFALKGDTVTLVVNDQPVYRRQLELTNQRMFGLFRYCDQTGARVRNMTWRGQWPTDAPQLHEQELIDRTVHGLMAAARALPATYRFQFGGPSFPAASFDYIGDEGQFTGLADGLRAMRASNGGYAQRTLVPRIALVGDFDVIAEFEDLQIDFQSDGNSGASLMALFRRPHPTEYSLRRGDTLSKGSHSPKFQASWRKTHPEGVQQRWPALKISEATSGKLRLARRGDRFYSLFAEGDSDVYQLVSEDEFPGAAAEVKLRLVIQHMAEGQSSVVWKQVAVRAAKIIRQDLPDAPAELARLNNARKQLAEVQEETFGKQELAARHWSIDPAHRELIAAGTDGLTITAPPAAAWRATFLAPLTAIGGDFDATFELGECQLAKADSGRNVGFFVQLMWDQRIVDTIVNRNSSGQYFLHVCQGGELPDNQRETYATVPLEGVPRSVRLIRAGDGLFAVVRQDAQQAEQLVVRVAVPTAPLPPAGLRLMVSSGSRQEASTVRVKSMALRAEKLKRLPAP